MKRLKTTALAGVAAIACAGGIVFSPVVAGEVSVGSPQAFQNWPAAVPVPAATAGTVRGWPAFVAMGPVGGPDVTPPTLTSTGGNDDFGGRPVDVVFKYAGAAGTGDPGIIDAPTNTTRMTGDLTILSGLNKHAMRVAMVEY